MRNILFVFITVVLFVRAASAQELVIISPHWEGMRYEFEAAFERWRKQKGLSYVKISWRDVGGTSEIVRYVQSEFNGKKGTLSAKSGGREAGIGVDLVFGGGTDPFETFKKNGLLARLEVDPEILSRVAPAVAGMPLYDREGYWFAPTMSAFGIFCNRKVLDKLNLSAPVSWEDLLQPAFRGWVTSADPRRSGSAHMFYEILLQAYGWDRGWQIIYDLAENYRTFLANSSQAIMDVVNAEVACGFAIDSQARAQIDLFPREQFFFTVPRAKSLYNGDGIAVLRGAPDFEAARSFVEFSLSEEAQKLLFLPSGTAGGPARYNLNRLPVLPELYQEQLSEVNPFTADSNDTLNFDSRLSSERWEIVNDLLGVFIIEAKDAGLLNKINCISALPAQGRISEYISQHIWSDQIERNKMISLWRQDLSECSGRGKLSLQSLPLLISTILAASLLFLKIFRRR